jgi:hypothetical protein
MKNNLAIIPILLFAFLIYVYRLNSIPPGVYVDEAVSAYDSYSILKIGKDHYGKAYPLAFRFFGAYTPGLFVYLNIIPLAIFGLKPFAIRLVSVFSALVQIFIFYKILQNIPLIKSKSTVLISTFVFAILPWTVFNARLGYEVMFAQTIFTLAIYFFYLALSRPKHLSLGLIFLSLSTHTAHTQRYLAPLFFLFYLIAFRPCLKKFKLALLIAFLIQLPNFYLITTKSFWVKGLIYQNSSINQIVKDFSLQIFQYISPRTLFYSPPDIDQQHLIPQISLFYFWLFIPFLIGTFRLFSHNSPLVKLILILFISGLIPASLSGHFISVQRILPLILPFSLLIALGLEKIPLLFSFPLILYSLILLWRSYFVLLPSLQSTAWNYGYDQITKIIRSYPNNPIVIDNFRNPRLYSLILFHLSYPPKNLHHQLGNYYRDDYYNQLINFDNLELGNISIRPINLQHDSKPGTLIIGDELTLSPSEALSHNLQLISEIKDPLVHSIFYIYQTR